MKQIKIQMVAILTLLFTGCYYNINDSDIDADLDESEMRCLIGEWNPTCAYPIYGNTWITHISRECDPIAPGLHRNPMSRLDGWQVQEPVPAIEFYPVANWPEDGFYCAGRSMIDLGPLEKPRCGQACQTCVKRCEAQYNGVRVMIAPECLLGAHTFNSNDLPNCP